MAVVNSGQFLETLVDEVGLTPTSLAKILDVNERTVRYWFAAETPPDTAFIALSDVLLIPLNLLRRAAAGQENLPLEYRERQSWLARKAAAAGGGGVVVPPAHLRQRNGAADHGQHATALRAFVALPMEDQEKIVAELGENELVTLMHRVGERLQNLAPVMSKRTPAQQRALGELLKWLEDQKNKPKPKDDGKGQSGRRAE